jgi:ribonuclease HII
MSDLLWHERDLWGKGHKLVAGVDEAGRGALAGPLLAAAVILPEEFDLTGVRDSKAFKKTQKRETPYVRIMAGARAVSLGWVSPRVIDEEADAGRYDDCHKDLLRRVVEALHPQPDFVLLDYYLPADLSVESLAIPDGEKVSASIAAASIVAKVTRDRMMTDLDQCFPQWGFAANKGYGGNRLEHEAAITEYGASSIHRLSSRGVRRALRRKSPLDQN